MYQDSQVGEPLDLNISDEMVRLMADNARLNERVKTAQQALIATRSAVRDWFTHEFMNGRMSAQIFRDEVNELMEDIDAKKLAQAYDVTIRISVTAQVEADDEDKAIELLSDNLTVNSSDYTIDWDVDSSSADSAI